MRCGKKFQISMMIINFYIITKYHYFTFKNIILSTFEQTLIKINGDHILFFFNLLQGKLMINLVPFQFFTIIEEYPNFYFQKYQLDLIFYQNSSTQFNMKVTEFSPQIVMTIAN